MSNSVVQAFLVKVKPNVFVAEFERVAARSPVLESSRRWASISPSAGLLLAVRNVVRRVGRTWAREQRHLRHSSNG